PTKGNSFSYKIFDKSFSPVILLAIIILLISFFTRIVLLISASASFEWSIGNLLGILFLGLVFDLTVSSFIIIPFVLLIWLRSETIYAKPWRWVVGLLLLTIILLIIFTNIIPKDFNGALTSIIIYYLIFRLLIFITLVMAGPAFRQKWRIGVLYFLMFISIFLLCFNAVSEWFFWDEFSSRYNFIAVDYLVYTTEVMGNIRESYPITVIMITVLAVALIIFFIIRSKLDRSVRQTTNFMRRSITAFALIFLTFACYLITQEKWKNFSRNETANELAGNGVYQFGAAYWQNELSFYRFYKTIPDEAAFRILRNEFTEPYSKFISEDIFSIEREVNYNEPEKKFNVVLISVESLSASFMQHFGGEKNITPYLDSLAGRSLFFTRLYASGTRTVRGLEALALSIPPTPGQSIVKRPGNENLFSIASVLNAKGYSSQYIYGGYGYFDNMSYFFGHNGYKVIDRTAIAAKDIHYQNIWGVADEDAFTLALNTMDQNYASGKPFFTQVMTVSNHRPYTYPENRIDIGPENQSREGAVKYTDFAINKFLKEASVKPWFANTVFVIVSDHCAASAGNVALPVTGYHIPMLIYAPAIIAPAKFDRLAAQVDIVPTILGILKLKYKSKFFGKDILNTRSGKESAFISTYQGLGFLTNDYLVIQKPLKEVRQFIPDFKKGDAKEVPTNDSVINRAISFYQCASWLISNGKYNAD
ncbi:MAG: sulfatase-like hydrolase/transferase, partial [Chitinophagaceae bacterium]